MVPRWFRALVGVQVAALVVFVVVGVHLASEGVHAAGQVVTWGRGLTAPPPVPSSWPRALFAPPSPSPAARASGAPPHDLLGRLNGDTARTAAGQYGLLQRLEAAIVERITRMLDTHRNGGG